LYGSSFTQKCNWEFGYWSGFSKLQNSDSDYGFENQTWFQSSFRELKPYLVTFFKFETVGSGKEVLHPLRKHLLRIQETSKLRTQSIKQAVSMLPSEVRFVGFGSMEGTFPFRIGGHLVQYFSVLVW
jgi:hypothetical protein